MLLRKETGKFVETTILPLQKDDLKKLYKKLGWNFSWRDQFKANPAGIFKLVTREEPDVIQGVVDLERKENYVLVRLAESNPHNVRKPQKYIGVGAHLFAYACKVSFESGFGGEIAFDSKTGLIEHYRAVLGAELVGGTRMIIRWKNAEILLNSYYKMDLP
jgi:hypothetical protein